MVMPEEELMGRPVFTDEVTLAHATHVVDFIEGLTDRRFESTKLFSLELLRTRSLTWTQQSYYITNPI
jgi:hypothetical protein